MEKIIQTFNTPEGDIKRELSAQEILDAAKNGSSTAKMAICADKLSKAVAIQDEIDAIKEFLGL